MRRPRHAIVLLLALGLLGFALPALALAGGCASCQQYTDPFGGSGGGKTTTHRTTATAPASTGSAPATTAPPATTPATPTTFASGTTAADPTATAAAAASTSSTGGSLPYTGYDGGLAALLGGGLVLSGAALRHRTRRSKDR